VHGSTVYNESACTISEHVIVLHACSKPQYCFLADINLENASVELVASALLLLPSTKRSLDSILRSINFFFQGPRQKTSCLFCHSLIYLLTFVDLTSCSALSFCVSNDKYQYLILPHSIDSSSVVNDTWLCSLNLNNGRSRLTSCERYASRGLHLHDLSNISLRPTGKIILEA
jgi:hypothetical protein